MEEGNILAAITATIIEKLYNKGCWGKGHLLTERLKHGDACFLNRYQYEEIQRTMRE